MPGRNPEEAWRDFRDPIRRTVGAVDLTTRLIQRRFPEERRLLATPSTGIAFGKELTLIFSLLLEPVPFETTQWRMTTRRYDYTIVHDSGDLVFGWHWHPESKRSRVTYPHIHVPSAGRYRTRHIPTGRISLEDVVLFGIDDLGVAGTYPTAREVVSEVHARHRIDRTWN